MSGFVPCEWRVDNGGPACGLAAKRFGLAPPRVHPSACAACKAAGQGDDRATAVMAHLAFAADTARLRPLAAPLAVPSPRPALEAVVPPPASRTPPKSPPRWAVAVVTAPRREVSYLEPCLRSLADAGFPEPTIFAEPGSPIPSAWRGRALHWPDKVGCWSNWLMALLHTYYAHPEADTFLMCEDDILLPCADVRRYLEQHVLWPAPMPQMTGLSLYTSNFYKEEREGWRQYDLASSYGWGNLCWVFPRRAVDEIVIDHDVIRHRFLNHVNANVGGDTVIGSWDNRRRGRRGVWLPARRSLAKHLGDKSAVWSALFDGQGLGGNRSESDWAGDEPGLAGPLVSIVVPVWDAAEQARQCVEAIRNNVRHSCEVVVVDNGSGPAAAAVCDGVRDGGGKMIRWPSNRGYSAACNAGIRESGGEFILLLNSDAYLSPGCLETLVEALRADPGLAAVGPLTDHASGFQGGHAGPLPRGTPPIETHRLVFFCVLMRRAAFAAIGLLDESMGAGLGNHEDDDWCRRATALGWRLAGVPAAWCRHEGSASFAAAGVDYGAHIRRTAEAFARKWESPQRWVRHPEGCEHHNKILFHNGCWKTCKRECAVHGEIDAARCQSCPDWQRIEADGGGAT